MCAQDVEEAVIKTIHANRQLHHSRRSRIATKKKSTCRGGGVYNLILKAEMWPRADLVPWQVYSQLVNNCNALTRVCRHYVISKGRNQNIKSMCSWPDIKSGAIAVSSRNSVQQEVFRVFFFFFFWPLAWFFFVVVFLMLHIFVVIISTSQKLALQVVFIWPTFGGL